MSVAIPLVVLIGTQSESPLPDIPLHDIAASGIVFALVIVFAWRYYEHQRDKKLLARLLERKADYEQDTNEDSQTP
tara:strand:+ start:257 stop:484 length:228 start_codon:yes stop_codon:yes gene_type:complete